MDISLLIAPSFGMARPHRLMTSIPYDVTKMVQIRPNADCRLWYYPIAHLELRKYAPINFLGYYKSGTIGNLIDDRLDLYFGNKWKIIDYFVFAEDYNTHPNIYNQDEIYFVISRHKQILIVKAKDLIYD